jgi:hypothetical protein
MVFILDIAENYSERSSKMEAYRNYLYSIRDHLSRGAYEFATADWHYDFANHQSPHDAWLESLVVLEPSSGDRMQEREIEIRVSLLGAYHDGRIELVYSGVRSYSFDLPFGAERKAAKTGHGDWLIDEVRLSDNGFALHEIKFSSGSTRLIECEEIKYAWLPIQ